MRARSFLLLMAGCVPGASPLESPSVDGISTWALVDAERNVARALDEEPFTSTFEFAPSLALGWTCDSERKLGLQRTLDGWLTADGPVRYPDAWLRSVSSGFDPVAGPLEMRTFELSSRTPCIRLSEQRETLFESQQLPRQVLKVGPRVLVFFGDGSIVSIGPDGTYSERQGLANTVTAAIVEDELWVVTHGPDLLVWRTTLSAEDGFEPIFSTYFDRPCGLENGKFALALPPTKPVERAYLVTFDAVVLELTRTGTSWRSRTLRSEAEGDERRCKTDPAAVWVEPGGVATVSRTLDDQIEIFTPDGLITERLPSAGVTSHVVAVPGKGLAIGDTAGGVFLRRSPGAFEIIEEGDLSEPPIGLLSPFADGVLVSASGGGGNRIWFEGYGICATSPSDSLPPLVWAATLGGDLVAVPARIGPSSSPVLRFRQSFDECRPDPR